MKNKIVIMLIPVLVIMGLFSACQGETEIVGATSVTVTFDPAGGEFGVGITEIDPIRLSRNKPLGEKYPADPIRTDYEFIGWFDGYTLYTEDDPINANVTLKAKWMKVDAMAQSDFWTVTFNAGSGGVAAATTVKVVKGKPLGYKYPMAWRRGFPFEGWWSGASEFDAATLITADVTLTAQWGTELDKWDVVFDAGEGNSFPASFTPDVSVDGVLSANKQVYTITVYDGESIWDKIPGDLDNGDSTANVTYFLVYWRDDDNRIFDENTFTPITPPYSYADPEPYSLTLEPRWGAPDYSVPLKAGEPNSPTLESIGLAPNNTPSNPVFRAPTANTPNGSIWNSVENNSPGRWQMMYWITLNLPEDFDVKYYSKYTVAANFFGNEKATRAYVAGHSEVMLPLEYTVAKTGDQMIPNRHGYGQISFCIDTLGTGEAAHGRTIFQQYNLGMGQEGDGGTMNQKYMPSNAGEHEFEYNGEMLDRDPPRPQVLLIQVSDDWIGRIEVTEIRFHNDPDAVGSVE